MATQDALIIDSTTGKFRRIASGDDLRDHLYKPGLAGGQAATGGTAAGDSLTFNASAAAGGGLVEFNHPIRSNYSEGNTTPAEQTGFGIWEPTFTTAGPYIGQMFRNDATITYTNAFYIYASVLDRSEHISNAATGFQAFTLFNALPTIRNGTSSDLVQMLVLNDGGTHSRITSGTSTAIQHISVNSAPTIRATVAGATMSWLTGACGMVFAPRYETATASSTVNMSTLAAFAAHPPAVALFSLGVGTNNATNYYGLWMLPNTFAYSGQAAAVFNEMGPAANKYCILNTGGAQSDFGSGTVTGTGQRFFAADLVGCTFGASNDCNIGWGGAGFFFLGFSAGGDQFRFSGGTNSNTIQSANFGGSGSELRLGFEAFHIGSVGAVGNQFMNVAAPAMSTSVAGEWATVNLSYSGNLTIDDAMTALHSWNINPISITSGTGSISGPITTLNVGGMTTSGVGTNETMGIRATGRTQQRGAVQFPPIAPSNLSGSVTGWNGLITATNSNSGRYWARITCDAATTLHGIDATEAQDGDTYEITNVGANSLTVANQSVTETTAANRIILGAFGGTLGVDETIVIRYDTTTARWRVTGD